MLPASQTPAAETTEVGRGGRVARPVVQGGEREATTSCVDAYRGQETLSCIYEQASTTRRSAGIPAMITGILSADASQPSFHDVIGALEAISQKPARVSEADGPNLPQVHALNCLKDVFQSSLLSKRAEPYLPGCLQLAASCLKSEV